VKVRVHACRTLRLDRAAESLEPDERRRLAAAERWEPGAASTQILLRWAVARRLGVPPGTVTVTRRCPACGAETHGRPEVPGIAVGLSAARRGNLVVVAVADVPGVGVDLETVPAGTWPSTLLDYALHPAERRLLETRSDAERSLDLPRWWSRKEAILKARGSGLAEDPGAWNVGALASGEAVEGPVPGERLWVHDLALPPGFVGSLAIAHPGAEILVDEVDNWFAPRFDVPVAT
jgi:4'-phosphopantetheinyl transferase